uniref:Uncharacterized protein n=1 Tax=Acrobeloides nanus TaxID=290746 RepID=A0A914EKI7_9BILA
MYLNDQLLDAVANSNLLSVKELLNSGANVNAHDGDFVTALQIAAARGDDEMVNLLINHGADVTKADQLGFSPFLRAIYGGHLKVIETLLLHYPSPEMATKETTYLGATPMTLACSGGHIKNEKIGHLVVVNILPK